MLSICVDFDWISSTYTPEQLGDDEDNAIAYKIDQEESLLQAITWYGVLVNLLLKLLCLNFAHQDVGCLLDQRFGSTLMFIAQ
jgi:hypothetical protein